MHDVIISAVNGDPWEASTISFQKGNRANGEWLYQLGFIVQVQHCVMDGRFDIGNWKVKTICLKACQAS